MLDHYYWYRARDEDGERSPSRLSYFRPRDPGALVDVSGAAVLKSSNEQALGQHLLAYLVSHDGQEVIAASESYEYPLRPGVVTAKPLKPVGRCAPPRSHDDLGDGRATLALLQQVGLL